MPNNNKGFLHNLSLVPAGLRYKLMIVFCLMSIIPLMICVYITTNFVFPYLGMTGSLGIVIAITIFIALMGLVLAKNMIEPIIDIAMYMAEELKQKISELHIMQSESQGQISVTVSAGVGENPIDGISAKELIDKARSLIKQAKDAGKNTVKV